MEDLVETITRGNPTEVKVLLASVALALGVYQLVVIAVGYGKIRLRFLEAVVAARAHRAVGDTILVLLVVVGVLCVAVYGWDDAHGVTGLALLALLGAKVAVVRFGLGLGRFLPVFGLGVFALLTVTWAMSAGGFLG